MKVGDLVKIKHTARRKIPDFEGVGVIIDVLETDFDVQLEVRFGHDKTWFNPIELEVISESR